MKSPARPSPAAHDEQWTLLLTLIDAVCPFRPTRRTTAWGWRPGAPLTVTKQWQVGWHLRFSIWDGELVIVRHVTMADDVKDARAAWPLADPRLLTKARRWVREQTW